MKVLVATRDGQGEVAGDFCFTVDGELVTPGMLECSSPRTCGCGRSFSGLASDRGTTTARVVDLPQMTRGQVRLALAESLRRGGWFSHVDARSADAMTDEQLVAIEAAVSPFEVGTLLGRKGNRLWDRAYPNALADLDRIDGLLRRLRERGRA